MVSVSLPSDQPSGVWFLFIPLALSLLGLTFVIISFFLLKRSKDPFHCIIFFLAIAEWCRAFWWMITYFFDIHNQLVCSAQAFGIEYFTIASWLWAFLFAVKLYASNILDRDLRHISVFHLVAWGVPGVICVVCAVYGSYGITGYWCWINYELFQILFGDCLLALLLACELFIFVVISWHLFAHQSFFAQLRQSRSMATFRMNLFLLVPVISWGWGIADRLVLVITGREVIWLQIVHGQATALQGFLNAVIYGWDPDLRMRWTIFMKKRRGSFSSSHMDIQDASRKPLLSGHPGDRHHHHPHHAQHSLSEYYFSSDHENAPPVDFDPNKYYDMPIEDRD
eukprot:TRINITY_DN5871_c0_g1_i2.p1 TRINITY_DN5871_c0_g1~~TRINITY_DN5871_c0_g1_i2.p1  ORF type:complete len:339 (-),score=38.30 TRINITY_DN5871_c0_g1_i2:73-1089(-)